MSASEAEPANATGQAGTEWFESFRPDGLSRLRFALISAYGDDLGVEAAGDMTSYAWEHRDRLATMANPLGYLFRVGQSAARRHRHSDQPIALPPVDATFDTIVDPDLPRALAQLSERQRVAVVLVHVNGWTYDQSADAMGIDVSSVRTHVTRGLARLKTLLEENDR